MKQKQIKKQYFYETNKVNNFIFYECEYEYTYIGEEVKVHKKSADRGIHI